MVVETLKSVLMQHLCNAHQALQGVFSAVSNIFNGVLLSSQLLLNTPTVSTVVVVFALKELSCTSSHVFMIEY